MSRPVPERFMAGVWFHGAGCRNEDGYMRRAFSSASLSGGLSLHFHANFPEHSGKFAGNGHLDFVVVHGAPEGHGL
jgi:hypothetical protein